MKDVSFNRISECYDDYREVPEEIIRNAIDALRSIGAIQPEGTLVDVACGTGRYLIPFSEAFAHSIGLDISDEMIAIARRKLWGKTPPEFVTSDARAMKLPTEVADMVISSKLFIHVPEWKQVAIEIGRITKPERYFVYINETGLFNNDVRKKFREICRDSKKDFGFLGEVDLDTVGTWFQENGFRRIEVSTSNLEWNHEVKYSEAYEAIEKRSFVEFQRISDSDYKNVLDITAKWIQSLPDGWNEKQQMHPKLRVDVFQKKGRSAT
jgi:ubiquinone/menaquinone biosynthesis C-methylase UbiE